MHVSKYELIIPVKLRMAQKNSYSFFDSYVSAGNGAIRRFAETLNGQLAESES